MNIYQRINFFFFDKLFLIILLFLFYLFFQATGENSHTESKDQNNKEFINKIENSIRKLKPEKYINNTKSVAELKDDYSMEDDLYIMSMRNDLMDMYNEYLNSSE